MADKYEKIELDLESSHAVREATKVAASSLEKFTQNVRKGTKHTSSLNLGLNLVGAALSSPFGLAAAIGSAGVAAGKFAVEYGKTRLQLENLATNAGLSTQQFTALRNSMEVIGEPREAATAAVVGVAESLKDIVRDGLGGRVGQQLLSLGGDTWDMALRLEQSIKNNGINGGLDQIIEEIKTATPKRLEALSRITGMSSAALKAVADRYEKELKRLPIASDQASKEIARKFEQLRDHLEQTVWVPMMNWTLRNAQRAVMDAWKGHGIEKEKPWHDKAWWEKVLGASQFATPWYAIPHWRDYGNFAPGMFGYKPFATGGIVMHPTRTTLGLDGPQAVIPLTSGQTPTTSTAHQRNASLPPAGGDIIDLKRHQRGLLIDIRDSLNRMDNPTGGGSPLTGTYTGPGSDSPALNRGGGGGGGAPGVGSIGALGGTVHGRRVEAYGPPELAGQTLYDPVSGKSLGGGVGGHSAAFGPGQHEGVDIMTPVGTPTYNPFERSRIIHTGGGGIDRSVTVEQIDAQGKPTGVYARFLHQQSHGAAGSVLKGGEQVGTSGYRNAPHTHFEMWHGEPSKRESYLLNPKAIYGWDNKRLPVGGQSRTALGAPPSVVGGTAEELKRSGEPIKLTSPYLANQRSALFKEVDNDPALRYKLKQIMESEYGGGGNYSAAVLEAMVNRAQAQGYKSLWTAVNDGFFGPVNDKKLKPLTKAQQEAYEKPIATVRAGSNLIDLRDDQGMRGEHHGQPGLTQYGDFYSYKHPKWAEEQRAKMRAYDEKMNSALRTDTDKDEVKIHAKINFINVPSGVKTNVDKDGGISALTVTKKKEPGALYETLGME